MANNFLNYGLTNTSPLTAYCCILIILKGRFFLLMIMNQYLTTISDVLPGTRATDNIYHLSGKEALFDVGVHIIAYLVQSYAVCKCSKVQEGDHERSWKVLKILSGLPLALQSLLVGQARLSCHRTTPHQAVTQNGPLKKFTVEQNNMSTPTATNIWQMIYSKRFTLHWTYIHFISVYVLWVLTNNLYTANTILYQLRQNITYINIVIFMQRLKRFALRTTMR